MKSAFLYFMTLYTMFPVLFMGQTQIKIMSYNVLNFPLGEIANRQDTLKKIIDYYEPDLFLLQELKSEEGLSTILDEVFNVPGNSHYASGTWSPQISNPNTSWPLQQNIIYNKDVFRLASERVILTEYRDINEFVLYLYDSELDNGADTTFFHIYVTHLKSSQGAANEEIRRRMADTLRTKINAIPADRFVIAGGDFNVYSSTEPAYQNLINPLNTRVMHDPIDAPGNWHDSSFPQKKILTQSTRLNAIYNDGAGGGLDDRFDFMLLSDNLMSPFSLPHYSENSYRSLGNNGTCYNQSIVYCDENNEVPFDILLAMYFMSDHLPVVLEIESQVVLSTFDILRKSNEVYVANSGSITDELKLKFRDTFYHDVRISIYNTVGQKILEINISPSTELFIPLSKIQTGMYLLEISNEEMHHVLQFIKR